jgi:hypothetical protein
MTLKCAANYVTPKKILIESFILKPHESAKLTFEKTKRKSC